MKIVYCAIIPVLKQGIFSFIWKLFKNIFKVYFKRLPLQRQTLETKMFHTDVLLLLLLPEEQEYYLNWCHFFYPMCKGKEASHCE